MKRRLKGWLLAACCAVLLGLAGGALAQEACIQSEIGYGGTVFDGRWYPLEVEVTGGDHGVSGVLSVGVTADYGEYDQLELPVSVPAGETMRFRLTISPKGKQSLFEVRLTADTGETLTGNVSPVSRVSPYAMLIGVLGGDETLCEALCVRGEDVLGRDEKIEAIALDPENFVQNAREMAAFDALAIDCFDVGTLTEPEQTLIEAWLQAGGIVLLGAGTEAQNSLSWFAGYTGVAAKQAGEVTGVVHALRNDLGLATEEEEETLQARALDAPAGDALTIKDGQCLMAASRVDEGLVLTCGFSLSERAILEEAEKDALWRRILLSVDSQSYNGAFNHYGKSNFSYGTGSLSMQRVSTGVSLLPVAIVLAVYVLWVGVGLYVLMKRRDRSKELWLAIPAAALAGVIAAVLVGGGLRMNQPAASLLRVTYVDRAGQVEVEEAAEISAANLERMTITGAQNERMERMDNGFYSLWSDEQPMELRDRVTWGENPAIEMRASAVWKAHDIVIGRDDVPEGTIDAQAWMAEDGLHVTIQNGMDVALEEAVLLTQVGYTRLGNIPAGASVDAMLMRRENVEYDKNGYPVIPEGVLLPYSSTMYRVISLCVNPELLTMTASDLQKSLNQQERDRRNRMESWMNTACLNIQGTFGCRLFAFSPELACTQLLVDGKPVGRNVSSSIVIKDIKFEQVSSDGYFYYPQGYFPASRAQTDKEDVPSLSEKQLESGTYTQTAQACFGFDLGQIDPEHIREIRIVSESYRSILDEYVFEVYDSAHKQWVKMDGINHVTLDGELLVDALGGKGELFMRYRALSSDADVGVYTPEIIVEGCEKL